MAAVLPEDTMPETTTPSSIEHGERKAIANKRPTIMQRAAEAHRYRKEKYNKIIEGVMNKSVVQTTLTTLLFVSLYLPDIWLLANPSNSADVVLNVLPSLELLELGGNQLTDAGTRLASPQDFRPFLAPDGFNAASCRGTVATYPAAAHASVLSTSQILWLPLGHRAQWRWSRRLGRL